jgi:hypothetical protein
MNRARKRVFRSGGSVVLPLPPDWLLGHGLGPGDEVEVTYDEIVRVRPIREKVASSAGVRIPGTPARRPAHQAETDEGGLVDGGS